MWSGLVPLNFFFFPSNLLLRAGNTKNMLLINTCTHLVMCSICSISRKTAWLVIHDESGYIGNFLFFFSFIILSQGEME